MVEPQKHVFESLVAHNSHLEGIHFENAAISDSNSTKNIYKLSFTSADWATSLASFDRKVLEKHITNGWIQKQAKEMQIPLPERLDDFFEVEEVRCLTLSNLLSVHNISHLDLLIIDTEGYDFEIIKQIDFKSDSPDLIVFEHKHLSSKIYRTCLKFLSKHQYHLFSDGNDTIAIRSQAKTSS